MTSSSVDVYQQQKYQQKQFDILKSLPVHIRKNVILSHFLSISVWLVGEHYAGVIGYIAGGGNHIRSPGVKPQVSRKSPSNFYHKLWYQVHLTTGESEFTTLTVMGTNFLPAQYSTDTDVY